MGTSPRIVAPVRGGCRWLSAAGLAVRTSATNIGDHTCPYGAGQHPYLTVGTEKIDPCRLQLDAERYLPTDDRGLPTGTVDVQGSDVDFRAERPIGNQDVDLTFTGLARDSDGLALGPADRPGRAADRDLGRRALYLHRVLHRPTPSQPRTSGPASEWSR